MFDFLGRKPEDASESPVLSQSPCTTVVLDSAFLLLLVWFKIGLFNQAVQIIPHHVLGGTVGPGGC